MATQRPGFSRVDTDHGAIQMNSLEHGRGEASSGSSKDNNWRQDGDSKSISAGVTELQNEPAPTFDEDDANHFGEAIVITDAKELVTHVLHVDDDPTMNPWTFRAFFLGRLGL